MRITESKATDKLELKLQKCSIEKFEEYFILNNKYQIFNDGKVFNIRKGREVKVSIDSQGFGLVSLGKEVGKVKIHRLLAKVFTENPMSYPHVGFKDQNRSNWKVENLQWYSNMEQLEGNKFGRLTVGSFVRKVNASGYDAIYWNCVCECGNSLLVLTGDLITGHTKSCGCLKTDVLQERNFKHGLSDTPEYKIWIGIRDRCNNLNSISAKDYAARGIIVEEPWNSNFEAFLEDMGTKPSQSHTIERVDVNGNYCKENCVWTDDRSLQAYNQRMKSSNTSGRTGVSFYDGRWYAIICGEYIMSTTDYEKALAAREAAEIERFGFNKE
jgi:hypothetical protein